MCNTLWRESDACRELAITATKRYELKRRAEAMDGTRRRITEATVALHQSLGPARTTVSEIARRAGVDRVTVYRHFPDDAALFAACSAEFRARNPPPDIATWAAIDDPAQRLRRALRDLYGYYERTEPMLSNVIRDAVHMPALRAVGAPRRRWLAQAESELSRGREGNAREIRDVIALAVDFHTWQTLRRERGVSSKQAVRLMAAMVEGFACRR